MSIVTLKRKTAAKYNNMSVGQTHFSLNGTHRSQGYVGQTMLSRSLPRTLMRGNTICGHGGKNGTYPVKTIVTDGTGLGNNMLNDNKVVKSSVLDTNGQLMTQYKWIRRPFPETSVKSDNTLNNNTQSEYLNRLKLSVWAKIPLNKQPGSVNNTKCCSDFMQTNYKNYLTSSTTPYNIAKPPNVIDQSEYIWQTQQQCKGGMIADYCTTRVNANAHQPFACNNVKFTPIEQQQNTHTNVIVHIP